jgi:hypothetical protein
MDSQNEQVKAKELLGNKKKWRAKGLNDLRMRRNRSNTWRRMIMAEPER